MFRRLTLLLATKKILFYTVIMATLGSFIVFITLSDTFGPSRPTVLVDAMVAACCGGGDKKEEEHEGSAIVTVGSVRHSFITRESERLTM